MAAPGPQEFNFAEFFADTDSEDDEFEGFPPGLDHDDSDSEDDIPLAHIGNPEVGVYHHQWLQDFTEHTGPRHHDETSSAGDIFSFFFTEELFALFAVETNRYAQAKMAALGGVDELRGHSRLHNWTDTTPAEMKVFVAVLLLMGLDRMPNYEIHWSTHPLLEKPGFR